MVVLVITTQFGNFGDFVTLCCNICDYVNKCGNFGGYSTVCDNIGENI